MRLQGATLKNVPFYYGYFLDLSSDMFIQKPKSCYPLIYK